MKKYTIFILITVMVVSGIVLFYERGSITKIFRERPEQILNSFEIPAKSIPECYPVEMVDYREVLNKDGGLMIFGRTLWSEKINSRLGGKPAVVPIEIYLKNNETGELELVKTGITSPEDGHIVFIIKNPEEKYVVKIDFRNAEDCPEEFKSSEKT